MPISCHFRDCKALLVASLTHISSAVACTRPLPLPYTYVSLSEVWLVIGMSSPALTSLSVCLSVKTALFVWACFVYPCLCVCVCFYLLTSRTCCTVVYVCMCVGRPAGVCDAVLKCLVWRRVQNCRAGRCTRRCVEMPRLAEGSVDSRVTRWAIHRRSEIRRCIEYR